MTTAEEELQRLAAASFGAWASIVDAYSGAVNAVWQSLAEWAYDEVLLDPVRCGDVTVHATHDTALRPALHHAATQAPLAPKYVTLSTDHAFADTPLEVRITLVDTMDIDEGMYHGHLVDDQDQIVSSPTNIMFVNT